MASCSGVGGAVSRGISHRAFDCNARGRFWTCPDHLEGGTANGGAAASTGLAVLTLLWYWPPAPQARRGRGRPRSSCSPPIMLLGLQTDRSCYLFPTPSPPPGPHPACLLWTDRTSRDLHIRSSTPTPQSADSHTGCTPAGTTLDMHASSLVLAAIPATTLSLSLVPTDLPADPAHRL
jgi:hypothetical protein